MFITVLITAGINPFLLSTGLFFFKPFQNFIIVINEIIAAKPATGINIESTAQIGKNFENTILPDNFSLLIAAAKMVRTPYLTPSGPEVINLNVGEQQSGTIQLSATINDTMYNNTNGIEPSQHITAAEYYIDAPPWLSEPLPVAFSMNASD